MQVSGCTSHCQRLTQLQQAFQSNSTVQSVGSGAALASALETPPTPGTTSQSVSTITQIQLGCLTQCFGTTTTDQSTAALAQLVLSQLGALIPPAGSSGVQPAPGTEQNAATQISCQAQVGGTDVGQVQSASQTNATVQIVVSSVTSLAPSTPETVDQTQQQTWQLQIGCLFYCVDSQQVQQAQQWTTTIQIVAGPTSETVQQTIWQVQVGCLAWCWNSTQSQQASQSTIVVVTSPPSGDGSEPGPGPGPPPALAPAPVSDPPSAASGASTPVPATPPPAPVPAVAALPPAPASRVVGATIRVLASPRRSGAAILTSWSVTGVPAPARGVVPASSPLPATRATAGSVPVREGAEVPSHRARPAANATPAPIPASLSAAALPTDRSLGGGGSAVALILAIVLVLTVRRRAQR